MDKPTEKQLNAIRKLARATKSSINLNKIASKQEASKIIDALIEKRNGKSSYSNNNNGCRDRKVAYGLATKLVFRKYQQLNVDYKKAENFWKDVDDFYKQYLRNQDRAIELGSSRR